MTSRPIQVLHVLPDLATGGGQKLVLDLAQALRPHAEVQVAFLTGPEDLRNDFEQCGVPVHPLASSGTWGQAQAVKGLVHLTRSHHIDVLHAHSSPDKHVTQAAGLITHRPVVEHLHVLRDHRTSDRPLGRRVRSKVRRVVGLVTVNRYIAISTSVMEANASALPRASERLVLIRNGIRLESAPIPRHVGLPRGTAATGEHQLLWVGRLSAEKDVPQLLEMMSHLRRSHPRVELLLAGEGPERQRIEREVVRLGLSGVVKLLGQRSDVSDLLALADVFVFTSISEGFGLAAAEAQAAGVPVVTYAIPAMTEIVEDDVTGVLVPDRDPLKLASAVARLLDDPELRTSMGQAARSRAERLFDITGTAEQLLAVYWQLTGRANV